MIWNRTYKGASGGEIELTYTAAGELEITLWDKSGDRGWVDTLSESDTADFSSSLSLLDFKHEWSRWSLTIGEFVGRLARRRSR